MNGNWGGISHGWVFEDGEQKSRGSTSKIIVHKEALRGQKNTLGGGKNNLVKEEGRGSGSLWRNRGNWAEGGGPL